MGYNHSKKRCIHRSCDRCRTAFTTGSSIKKFCSDRCRFLSICDGFTRGESCWEWPVSRNPQTGYGQIMMLNDKTGRKEPVGAHRAAYTFLIGKIPSDMNVLHRCDNPGCFNPDHLFLGTQKDNVADMVSKGRALFTGPKLHWVKRYPEKIKRGADHHLSSDASCLPRGSSHHNSKITEQDVLFIRSCDLTLFALSEKYGMAQSSLSSIRRRKTWRHVA